VRGYELSVYNACCDDTYYSCWSLRIWSLRSALRQRLAFDSNAAAVHNAISLENRYQLL